jgi:serine/threonine-protein kinase
MEYLEGRDLSFVRKEQQPLAVDVAVSYVLQAASAIAEAHARGIVHRDLKPGNLFLSQRHDGSTRVKVLDFGISKTLDPDAATGPHATKSHAVLGSVHYMSPEQMTSTKNVDARTDVWALGVILYELLTARIPFPGQTLMEIGMLVMTKPPPPPRSFRPDLPEALEALILHCLEKQREDRVGSVSELMQALAPFAGAEGVPLQKRLSTPIPAAPPGPRADAGASARSSAPVIVQAGQSSVTTGGVASDRGRSAPKRTVVPIVASVGVLAVIGLVGAFVVARQRAAPASDSGHLVVGAPSEQTSAKTPESTPGPKPEATPSNSAPAATAPPSATVAPDLPTKGPRSPINTPSQPPKPATITKPAPNCNPPFTVDSNGMKHAKPECL